MPMNNKLNIDITSSFDGKGFKEAQKAIQDLTGFGGKGGYKGGFNPQQFNPKLNEGTSNFVRQINNRRQKVISATRQYNKELGNELNKTQKLISNDLAIQGKTSQRIRGSTYQSRSQSQSSRIGSRTTSRGYGREYMASPNRDGSYSFGQETMANTRSGTTSSLGSGSSVSSYKPSMYSFPKDSATTGLLGRMYDFGIADLTFRMVSNIMSGMGESFSSRSELPTNLQLMTQIDGANMTQSEIPAVQSFVNTQLGKYAPKQNKYEFADVMSETGMIYKLNSDQMIEAMKSASPMISRFQKEGRSTRDAILAFRDMFEGEMIRGREVGIDKALLKDHGYDPEGGDYSPEAFMSYTKAIQSIGHERGWDAQAEKVKSYGDIMSYATSRITEAGADIGGLFEGKISGGFNALKSAGEGLYTTLSKADSATGGNLGQFAGESVSTSALGIAGIYMFGKTISGAGGLGENLSGVLGRGEQYNNARNRFGWISPYDASFSTRRQGTESYYAEMKNANARDLYGKGGQLKGKGVTSLFPQMYSYQDSHALSDAEAMQAYKEGATVGYAPEQEKNPSRTTRFKNKAKSFGSQAYNALGGPLGVAMIGAGIAEGVYSYVKSNSQLLDNGSERMQKGFNADQNRLSSTQSSVSSMQELTKKLEANRQSYEKGTAEYNRLTGQINSVKNATTTMKETQRIIENEQVYDQTGLSNYSRVPNIDTGNNNEPYYSDGEGGYVDINGKSYKPITPPKTYNENGNTIYGEAQKKVYDWQKSQEIPTDGLGNLDMNSTQFKDLMVSGGYVMGDKSHQQMLGSLINKGGNNTGFASQINTIGTITSDGVVSDDEVSSLQSAFNNIRKTSGANFSDEQIARNLPEITQWMNKFGAGSEQMKKADDYLTARERGLFNGDFNSYLKTPEGQRKDDEQNASRALRDSSTSNLAGDFFSGLIFSSFGKPFQVPDNLFQSPILSALGDLFLPSAVSASNPTTTTDSGSPIPVSVVDNGGYGYASWADAKAQGVYSTQGKDGRWYGNGGQTNQGTASNPLVVKFQTGQQQTGQPTQNKGGGFNTTQSNMFGGGGVGGNANSEGNRFTGTVQGTANSVGNRFTGTVQGYAKSVGNRFTGTISGTATASGASFTGSIGGSVTIGNKTVNFGGSNATTRDYVDPTLTEVPTLPKELSTLPQQENTNNSSSTVVSVNEISVTIPESQVENVSDPQELGNIIANELVETLQKEAIKIGE